MRLHSQNEHRITETEEAVFLFHGHLVGMHGLVVAIQCGNEHDQGALRQVAATASKVRQLVVPTAITR